MAEDERAKLRQFAERVPLRSSWEIGAFVADRRRRAAPEGLVT